MNTVTLLRTIKCQVYPRVTDPTHLPPSDLITERLHIVEIGFRANKTVIGIWKNIMGQVRAMQMIW